MAGRDLMLFIIAIVVLWIIWFVTGGPERGRTDDPFLNPPAPLDDGSTYSAPQSRGEHGSLFADEVRITQTNAARSSNPQQEYITIEAARTNREAVRIDNWHVRNKNGARFEIGPASQIPLQGEVNTESALHLAPGERAFLVTGNSPIGVSFQTNMCSGYLDQHLDFSPPLSQSCPDAGAAALRSSADYDPSCIRFISSLPQCHVYLDEVPDHVSDQCAAFIRNERTYNGCVDRHKDRGDFLKPEWRVYLGENNEIWNNRSDLIRLYDNRGRLVDSFAY